MTKYIATAILKCKVRKWQRISHRKLQAEPVDSEELEERLFLEGHEETVVNNLAIRQALDRLDREDRELLLLRYVNEVPMAALASLFGMSRFALHRRLKKLLKEMKESLEGGR